EALAERSERLKLPPMGVPTKKLPRRQWFLPAIGGAALVALIAAGGFWFSRPGALAPANTAVAPQASPPAPTTLRASAQARGFLIGAVAHLSALRDDPVYGQVLAREYNIIGPAVEGTAFAWVHPDRTVFNFSGPDAVIDFASTHGMTAGGPPLVWWANLPPWLINGKISSSEASDILREYIQTMVRRYRGRVRQWAIVWDVFDNLGNMRESFWLKALGPDYVAQAFIWAREADPVLKLILNQPVDFDPLGARSEAAYNLLRKFRTAGIPVDGVSIGSALLLDRL